MYWTYRAGKLPLKKYIAPEVPEELGAKYWWESDSSYMSLSGADVLSWTDRITSLVATPPSSSPVLVASGGGFTVPVVELSGFLTRLTAAASIDISSDTPATYALLAVFSTKNTGVTNTAATIHHTSTNSSVQIRNDNGLLRVFYRNDGGSNGSDSLSSLGINTTCAVLSRGANSGTESAYHTGQDNLGDSFNNLTRSPPMSTNTISLGPFTGDSQVYLRDVVVFDKYITPSEATILMDWAATRL